MSTDRVNGVDIPVLKGLVDTLSTSVTTLQSAVTTVQDSNGAQDSAVAAMQAAVNAVQSANIAQELHLADQDSEILATQAALTELSTTVSTLYGPDSLVSGLPTAAKHVYLRTGGNDANAGTAAAPKATWAGVWALLPLIQSSPFVVHVGAGSLSYTAPPANEQLGPSAFIVLLGDGGGAAGDDGCTVVGTGTVTTGSTNTTLKTTALTAGAYAGCTIEMLTGNYTGCRRSIKDNTTTDVLLTYAMTSPSGGQLPATNGNTFRVTRPNAILSLPLGYWNQMTLGQNTNLWLVNVAIQGLDTTSTAYFWTSEYVNLYGVELLDNVSVTCGAATNVQAGNVVFSPFARDPFLALQAILGISISIRGWQGWGLTSRVAARHSFLSVEYGASFTGFYCGQGGGFYNAMGSDSTLRISGGRLSALQVNRGAVVVSGDSGLLLKPVEAGQAALSVTHEARLSLKGPVDFQIAVESQAIVVSGIAQVVMLGDLTIASTATGVAIDILESGQFESPGLLTFTSHAGVAVRVTGQGQLRVAGAVGLSGTNGLVAQDEAIVLCGAALSAGMGLTAGGSARVTIGTTFNASPSGANRGLFVTDNAEVRVGTALSVISSGSLAALQGSGNGRLFVSGATTLTCSSTAVPLFMNGAAQISLGSTVTLTNAGTGYSIELSDQARLYAPATIGITATVGPGGGFSLSDLTEIIAGGITANAPLGSRMRDTSRFVARIASLTGAVNNPALALFGQTLVTLGSRDVGYSVTFSAHNPGSGAFNVAHGAKATVHTLCTFTCNNTATAANSDGVRIQNGGELYCCSSPFIGTTGSSGYGVNCRGGGKFSVLSQPANVIGPTADFSVGPNAGDDFNDEVLAASYAARVSGASVIYRGTL